MKRFYLGIVLVAVGFWSWGAVSTLFEHGVSRYSFVSLATFPMALLFAGYMSVRLAMASMQDLNIGVSRVERFFVVPFSLVFCMFSFAFCLNKFSFGIEWFVHLFNGIGITTLQIQIESIVVLIIDICVGVGFLWMAFSIFHRLFESVEVPGRDGLKRTYLTFIASFVLLGGESFSFDMAYVLSKSLMPIDVFFELFPYIFGSCILGYMFYTVWRQEDIDDALKHKTPLHKFVAVPIAFHLVVVFSYTFTESTLEMFLMQDDARFDIIPTVGFTTIAIAIVWFCFNGFHALLKGKDGDAGGTKESDGSAVPAQ